MRSPSSPIGRLPDWTRSIRVRYTLLYSAVLFGLAALVVVMLYVILSMTLAGSPVTSGGRGLFCNQITRTCIRFAVVDAQQIEKLINAETLDKVRNFSFKALAVMFVASLGVGWVIAGRVLAPIERITSVAREIQATDLSRRIELGGPEDELRRLADTFDAMLARLDAAFAAQRQFLADASHELRNPLAIIRTNLDVALADPDNDPEELRRSLLVIQRAGDRMSHLVDDLLALARGQALAVHSELIDLGAAVADASDELVLPAKNRDITLDRTIVSGVVVSGDYDALKRAVSNLLENAVRYAPPGSRVRLAVGSERSRAWVSVSDEGPGIAPEDQQRVFDRFWRADKGRSRAEGGTGLGLAIVRQITNSHGGEVQVQSKVGVGSTFTIWLPVAAVDGASRPRARLGRSAATELPRPTPGGGLPPATAEAGAASNADVAAEDTTPGDGVEAGAASKRGTTPPAEMTPGSEEAGVDARPPTG
ncbi:MAG TPA: HAMP domain-containing sensor histidine kinase [Actinomycetota bacterium]|nr:HAMP domain-containing sensor histidine kinase [Actinomycetota bacterium]